MELHGNIFCILSYALSINDQYNWDKGLRDIFYYYKLIPCQKGKDRYTLSLDETDGSFLMQCKTIKKGWKDHAAIISGEWLCLIFS